MQDLKEEFYSIGALAKMAGISTPTLRYYDEIGLFMPHRISDETQYRYYTADQAVELARIIELKSYGFSLSEIKYVLKQGDMALTDVYLNRYWALEHEKKKIQAAIDLLSEKIKHKLEGSNMNKKILLIDNEVFIRAVYKDILTREGYEIAGETYKGNEGVELYKSLRPEGVILNIDMPNLDGLEILRLIKEYDENAHIIMVSYSCNAHTVINAIKAGAKYFIAKPFKVGTLISRLESSFTQSDTANKEIADEMLTIVEDLKDRELSQMEIDLIIKILCSNADFEWQSIIKTLGETKMENPDTDVDDIVTKPAFVNLVNSINESEYIPDDAVKRGFAGILFSSPDISHDSFMRDAEIGAMISNIGKFMLEKNIDEIMIKNPIKDSASPINMIYAAKNTDKTISIEFKHRTDESTNETDARFNKLEKTQEEILEILRSLKE